MAALARIQATSDNIFPQLRYFEPMTVMPGAYRAATARSLTRGAVFPAVAVAVTVLSADIRTPLGLPGHRGLIWLTLLVAVALTARRPETVIGVGATSTVATLLLHVGPGPWASGRYLAAAVLLYAVVATPALRRRQWLVVLAAAPIHLVALAGSIAALLGGGHYFALASVGLTQRVLFHLAFGLAAGLLAWAIARGMDRLSPSLPR